ncbi:MAG TPA: cellulase family glycosylhydrolase [Candidatus Dormibacteraeota bacterium]|nr:cellulase family glycosylhydrolase [Candidatus Dormibacteraeota bacterium]
MDRVRRWLSRLPQSTLRQRLIAAGIALLVVVAAAGGGLALHDRTQRARTPRPAAERRPTPSPGRDATPTSTPSPAPGPGGLPPLSVSGNQILAGGKPTHLVGVNYDGTEYACFQGRGIFDSGAPDTVAGVQALQSWHVRFVRMPLNEDCWLGINGVPAAFSGARYQAAVVHFVTELNQAGIYVDLDLHNVAPGSTESTLDLQMADLDHAPAFWSSVAGALKGDPDVVFDVYNEPHALPSWSCWLNGSPAPDTAPCTGVDYAVAGMQSLVNAVRQAGATTQPILLSGMNFASDITGIPANLPFDPDHALVADAHVYGPAGDQPCNTPACFSAQFLPVLDGQGQYPAMPIMVDESGEDYENPTTDCSTTVVKPMYQWLNQYGIGYASWVWNAAYPDSDCMRLVDTTGGQLNPGDPYAAFVQQNLAQEGG